MAILVDYGYKKETLTIETLTKHLSIYKYISLIVDGEAVELENRAFNKSLGVIVIPWISRPCTTSPA